MNARNSIRNKQKNNKMHWTFKIGKLIVRNVIIEKQILKVIMHMMECVNIVGINLLKKINFMMLIKTKIIIKIMEVLLIKICILKISRK